MVCRISRVRPGDLKLRGVLKRNKEHFRGCLLGGAVGDALGAPVEFASLEAIKSRFGPAGVTSLRGHPGGKNIITDDTQMTLFTAEGLLRAITRQLEKGICSPPLVGPGRAHQRN